MRAKPGQAVNPDLIHLLLKAGILQFGRFGEAEVPFRLKLELLPSYPDILEQIIKEAAPLVGQVDHLVSSWAATPLGVGLSLKMGVPLVYSRGNGDAPVYDLVGAYDIGHPAVLLANDLHDGHGLVVLANKARQVGLEIKRLLVIVDDGGFVPDSLPLVALMNLPASVENLIASGYLPAGHAEAVNRWFQEHARISPRPD